ncbi:hypothetical protein J2X69_000039 [Algoriphagus sp. 4150]|uniref:hypothetical protein n=1 Tax=Algoriphagus sp. 4150 TaxID=2817756 RepID=UPI00285A2F1D|nr:hypothetical protein [Algoriphagus sp. 4150]MDR7127711.1 hypothetical protein [Algoriphagus sp. 4150]
MDNKIEIYQGPNGQTQIEVRFENETTWLTNSQLVELFKSSKANISEHIKNIFESEKLEKTQLFGISEQFKWKVKEL